MKVKSIVIGRLSVGALAVPTASNSNYVIHENRVPFGHTWSKGEAIVDNVLVPVCIALKQTNLENGMAYLVKVEVRNINKIKRSANFINSDPGSPSYSQHYTEKEVAKLFATTDDTIAAVTRWLISNGISERDQHHEKQTAEFFQKYSQYS